MPTVQAYTQERGKHSASPSAPKPVLSPPSSARGFAPRSPRLIITAVMGTIIFVLWIGAHQVAEGA
jgi:ATP-binding cassette, subfamily B, bacterial